MKVFTFALDVTLVCGGDGLRQHRIGKKFRLVIYSSRKLGRWFSKVVELDVTCSHFPHVLLTLAVVDNFMLSTLQVN